MRCNLRTLPALLGSPVAWSSASPYRLRGTTIPDNPQDQQTAVSIAADDKLPSKQAARLENIFHNLPSAVIVTDRDGRIHNMNQAARSLLGEPSKDLQFGEWPRTFGFYLQDGVTLFPAENLPTMRALQGVKDVPAVDLLLRSRTDGKEHKLSMSARAIQTRNGDIDGITVFLQEITPRSDAVPSLKGQDVRYAEGLSRLSNLLADSANDVNRIANALSVVSSEIMGGVSAVALLEPGRTRLNLVALHDSGTAPASQFKDLMGTSVDFAGTKTLENSVMSSGLAVITPSDESAGSLPSLLFGELMHAHRVEAVLMVPLVAGKSTLGVISLLRNHGGQPYTPADQLLLTDIASRAALAIENRLLFESLQAEISARMSAAEALKISEERFQSIFESTGLGIKILDLSGTILETNAAFQKIIGYPEVEIVGRRFYDFLHPSDMAKAVSVFQKIRKDGVPSLRFEHRAIRKNGDTVWVNATFSAVRKGRGDERLAFIVSILEDVSADKQLEAEMVEMKNRMQSGMELERLRLAHELHDGPMQDLYSIAYELEELRGKAGSSLDGMVGKITENIHLVLQELRETAKELRPPTISQFGLEKTIRSYVADMNEQHPELSIQLWLARDHQLLPEEVRLALFRVLQQSLMNIVRHAQATEVRVRFTFDAEEARLEVWDNGKGFRVPANWIDLVRQGHFGLAGAAERVNALGGHFVVESQPESSTTVQAVIPWREYLV